MKNSFNRAMAFVVVSSAFLLAVAGCSKSNSGSSGSGMSATVSGTVWANSFPTVGVYSNAGGLFEIVGLQFKGGDSTGFELAFVSPITLNKPVSTDTSETIISYSDSKTQAGYGALIGFGHAVLTITSYDSTGHSIAGTFSGTLINAGNLNDSIVVTNGKFSTSFQAQ